MIHTRRSFFAGLAALTAGSGVAGGLDLQAQSVQPIRRIQTTLDLWGPEPRQSEALIGSGQPDYAPQGSAYSASGRPFCWGFDLAQVVYVHWGVVWNTGGNGANGIRLQNVWGPGAPIIGEITHDLRNGPVTTGLDVTLAFQAMQRAKQSAYLFQMLRGNPVVFQSSLTMVWDLS